MSIENATRRRLTLLESVGQVGLNIKYPDEFELYVVALELLDENFNTLYYFIFPVMPSSLSDDSVQLHSIKKTLSGVHVLSTTNFIPTDINLSGTFGRRLKVLLNGNYTDLVSSFKAPSGKTTLQSITGGVEQIFDENVKTGYGCTKILEAIINKTTVIDTQGGIKTLLFHNLALGNSYIVRPVSLKLSQSQERNMLWDYSLVLKSLAPISALYSSKTLKDKRKELGATDLVQKGVDTAISRLTGVLSKYDDRYVRDVKRPAVRKAKDYIKDKF